MPLIVSGDCVVLLMNSVLRLLIFKHHSYSSFSSSLIMVSACTVEEVRIVRSSAYAIRSPLFNACSSNFDDLRAASRKTLNRSGERTLFWATPLLLVTVCWPITNFCFRCKLEMRLTNYLSLSFLHRSQRIEISFPLGTLSYAFYRSMNIVIRRFDLFFCWSARFWMTFVRLSWVEWPFLNPA